MAALGDDAVGLGGVVEAHAKANGEGGKRLGQVVHAALHRPDALGLGPPDQGEDGRGPGGAATDIGGVAGEKLDQAGVAEVVLQEAGKRHAGQKGGPEAGLAQRRMGDGAEIRLCGAHDGRVEGMEQGGGKLVEAAEGGGLARAGEGLDCGEGRFGVGVQVEGGPVGPPVAREDRLRDQGDVVVETLVRQCEEVVEDLAHGQDGGACIHGSGGRGQGPHLAAGGGCGLDHRDVAAGGGKADGGGEAPHSGANDND